MIFSALAFATMHLSSAEPLSSSQLAKAAFGNDAAWYEANIPFFECSDPKIQEIYYYRWRLYKAHIRDVGERGTVITEFLDDVGWQKWPFASLNDATPFHIKEGRWLRDPHPVDEYIDNLYFGGGNDRHFAEGIAEATYQNFLARGDLASAAKYLPVMRHIYNLWDDHFDFGKGLYWIEPLLDATEYTISSIDATGGKDGFFGGQAFRPTINAYQFGNANAIARLSALTNDRPTADQFTRRAQEIKQAVQKDLWSDQFKHFIDRHQTTNAFVHYWEPIRGRELAGYVPWVYSLPDDNPTYLSAWSHVLSPSELAGPFGLRTVEPSYESYMRQYRYLGKQPECQWNGPSWPFQTTQVLTGLANVLNDYHSAPASAADYLRLLQQYTAQHYLNGTPNLQEDYNPDTGGPIVGLDRSHHYNHSGYIDLIVTGLCGIRPEEGNRLTVNPLIPNPTAIPYLCLQDLPYHGHRLTVIWDADGQRYRQGKGLIVYVDGAKKAERATLGKLTVDIPKPIVSKSSRRIDSSLNIYKQGFPKISASVNQELAWQAVDGRSWYFPEIPHGWTTGSSSGADWFSIDYSAPTNIAKLHLEFAQIAPEQVEVQIWAQDDWKTVATIHPITNGPTEVRFPDAVQTERLRLTVNHHAPVRLVRCQTFAQE